MVCADGSFQHGKEKSVWPCMAGRGLSLVSDAYSVYIWHRFVVSEPELFGRAEGDLFTCSFIFSLLPVLTPLGNFPKCLNCMLL